jgi:hypothetical protein
MGICEIPWQNQIISIDASGVGLFELRSRWLLMKFAIGVAKTPGFF